MGLPELLVLLLVLAVIAGAIYVLARVVFAAKRHSERKPPRS